MGAGVAADTEFFNDAWVVRAHHPDDADWTASSYATLGVVSCVDDFWTVWNSVAGAATRTMLFVTREHVFPAWDDPACIDGCTASFVCQERDVVDAFGEVVRRALGETIAPAGEWDSVVGVSIAPKRGFHIVKVWSSAAAPPEIALPAALRGQAPKVTPCRRAIAVRNDAVAQAPVRPPPPTPRARPR